MIGATGIPVFSLEGSEQASVMHGFAARQADFARAILDPVRPAPAGLVGPDGRPSERRFAVYRNNVVVGLIETLKAAYPVARRLVGEEFFAAMASLHVVAEPPVSPIMLDYGAGFPAFIARFEPAAVLAYLPDVARLERAWVEAYHAAEASPLSPSALGQVPPGDVLTMRLTLHPTVRIVRSAFPIVSIWQANVGGDDAGTVALDAGGEDALVARPETEVEIRRLPAGAAAFMEALRAGAPIVEAMKEGLFASPCFDLAIALRGMIEANVIVGYDVRPARSEGAA
ncbi:putative DNA-binding domain-containing protein [Ancylobacter sp. Lp-2]|uniref:HvfC/BufC N-terminal domain-containing protein n=1 Tax=Ancylobacter sp. Lp-2 TaxID=2881339 RepID=UPI001E4D1E27|nr:DNA-binding domain-containing protein [Ancylobacter sp. Lp-2]MCB4770094.1 putative DNA-binding domain-containing protein [Ancylobacter sp. Lp-2]